MKEQVARSRSTHAENFVCPNSLQSWHASYNRWLVRYLYVPLGGSRKRILNVWVVFSFVALWHDPDPRLLVRSSPAFPISISRTVTPWRRSPRRLCPRSNQQWSPDHR